jgi:flagellar basal-body rod protein FlgC
MSIQRKKMELISENIANADSVRTADGKPYQRKTLEVKENQSSFAAKLSIEGQMLKLNTKYSDHLAANNSKPVSLPEINNSVEINEKTDVKPGELIYMPEHPDADDKGYVQMSNVNVLNEMVDMIAATRSYEANLTALNSSKQMIKDSLEI